MPANLSLSNAHVHVWQSPTVLPPPTLAHLTSLLSPDERQLLDRLRIPSKKAESLVARGLLRHILGQLLQLDPRSLRFTAGPHGKPELTLAPTPGHNQRIYFNVSHTRNRVLLAISLDHPVGIDVEFVRPKISHEELAQRFFTPTEHAAIRSLPPPPAPDQRAAFFRCWTRKEAILKALGSGIAGGLDKFNVPVLPLAESILLATPDLALDAEWTLCDLPVEIPYLASLAVAGRYSHLRTWTIPVFSMVNTGSLSPTQHAPTTSS